jgi:hypothetical protein
LKINKGSNPFFAFINYYNLVTILNFRLAKDSTIDFVDSHLVDYPTPINLNYF